jgi:hypothetical protein
MELDDFRQRHARTSIIQTLIGLLTHPQQGVKKVSNSALISRPTLDCIASESIHVASTTGSHLDIARMSNFRALLGTQMYGEIIGVNIAISDPQHSALIFVVEVVLLDFASDQNKDAQE